MILSHPGHPEIPKIPKIDPNQQDPLLGGHIVEFLVQFVLARCKVVPET